MAIEKTERKVWERPVLQKLGTLKDVAGPVAGLAQNANKS